MASMARLFAIPHPPVTPCDRRLACEHVDGAATQRLPQQFASKAGPVIYDIVHRTTYRFHREVEFDWHRLLFRPRDGHDMRVLATDLLVEPQARQVDLVQDVYGNSIALVLPASKATQLAIESRFTVEHVGLHAFDLPVATETELLPPAYTTAERLALQPFLLPCHEDEGNVVRQWAQRWVGNELQPRAREVISRMAQGIRDSFRYEVRPDEGTQNPVQTLALGSGSCRDFATLMIDALQRLGIAARFVSGYVYSPGSDAPGSTHAWLQCYLPRCGWFAVDPTNNLLGGQDLIRVAVARRASEVAPLSGTWVGQAESFAGMDVAVTVTAR